MTDRIAIYEPLYAKGQVLSDPAFKPLPRAENVRPEWREFGILVDMYRAGVHRQHRFTGLFSPKFRLKTKLTGDQFIAFVQEQHDADVCFVNPFPQIAYWSYNVWMQGEYAHKGIVEAATELCHSAGLGWDIRGTPRHGARELAYSNFWVGTESFWESYVGGVLIPIAEFLETNSDHAVARNVMVPTDHTDPAPFLPFIIERLFSTFLSRMLEVRATAYPLTERIREYCNNDFECLLFERMRLQVDAADAAGKFPADLLDWMDTVCALWQQHFFDFYAQRPHPHTSRPIVRA